MKQKNQEIKPNTASIVGMVLSLIIMIIISICIGYEISENKTRDCTGDIYVSDQGSYFEIITNKNTCNVRIHNASLNFENEPGELRLAPPISNAEYIQGYNDCYDEVSMRINNFTENSGCGCCKINLS